MRSHTGGLVVRRFCLSHPTGHLGVRTSRSRHSTVPDRYPSIRHYIGVFREESLLGELECRLSVVKTHGFKVLSLQPYQKDGGVFVKFTYNASDKESALRDIEDELRAEADDHAMPSWAGLDWGNVWLVKGQPWLEVRFYVAW